MGTAQLLGIGILGAAVYLLMRPGALLAAQSAISQQVQDAFSKSAQQTAYEAQVAQQQQAKQRQMIAGTVSTATGVTTAAIGATAALTAGITAGVGLVAWGILEQGWFRGGWEGVTGNALRDRFIDQFVQIYYPGAGSEMQFDSLVRALAEIGVVGENARMLIAALYSADSESEMSAAIRSIASAFAAKGIKIAVPQF